MRTSSPEQMILKSFLNFKKKAKRQADLAGLFVRAVRDVRRVGVGEHERLPVGRLIEEVADAPVLEQAMHE